MPITLDQYIDSLLAIKEAKGGDIPVMFFSAYEQCFEPAFFPVLKHNDNKPFVDITP